MEAIYQINRSFIWSHKRLYVTFFHILYVAVYEKTVDIFCLFANDQLLSGALTTPSQQLRQQLHLSHAYRLVTQHPRVNSQPYIWLRTMVGQIGCNVCEQNSCSCSETLTITLYITIHPLSATCFQAQLPHEAVSDQES